jgi:hypothetical protein
VSIQTDGSTQCSESEVPKTFKSKPTCLNCYCTCRLRERQLQLSPAVNPQLTARGTSAVSPQLMLQVYFFRLGVYARVAIGVLPLLLLHTGTFSERGDGKATVNP